MVIRHSPKFNFDVDDIDNSLLIDFLRLMEGEFFAN